MSRVIIIGLVLIMLVLSGCVPAPPSLSTKQVQAMIDDTIIKRLNAANIPAQTTSPPAAPIVKPTVAAVPTPTPVNLAPIEARISKLEQALPVVQVELANNKISNAQINLFTQRMNKIQASLDVLNLQIDAYANRGTIQLNNLQVQITSPNQILPNLVSVYPQSVDFTVILTNPTSKTLNNVNIVGYIRSDRPFNMVSGYPQIVTRDNKYGYLIGGIYGNAIQFNVVNGAGVVFPISPGGVVTLQPRLMLQTIAGGEYPGIVNFTISIYSISYDIT